MKLAAEDGENQIFLVSGEAGVLPQWLDPTPLFGKAFAGLSQQRSAAPWDSRTGLAVIICHLGKRSTADKLGGGSLLTCLATSHTNGKWGARAGPSDRQQVAFLASKILVNIPAFLSGIAQRC